MKRVASSSRIASKRHTPFLEARRYAASQVVTKNSYWGSTDPSSTATAPSVASLHDILTGHASKKVIPSVSTSQPQFSRGNKWSRPAPLATPGASPVQGSQYESWINENTSGASSLHEIPRNRTRRQSSTLSAPDGLEVPVDRPTKSHSRYETLPSKWSQLRNEGSSSRHSQSAWRNRIDASRMPEGGKPSRFGLKSMRANNTSHVERTSSEPGFKGKELDKGFGLRSQNRPATIRFGERLDNLGGGSTSRLELRDQDRERHRGFGLKKAQADTSITAANDKWRSFSNGEKPESAALSSTVDIMDPSYNDSTDNVLTSPSLDLDNLTRKGRRTQYKDRGSLLAHPVDIKPITKSTVTKKKTMKKPVPQIKAKRELHLPKLISVSNLARLLEVRQDQLQRIMSRSGMGDISSYDHMLTSDDSCLIALEYGYEPVVDDEAGFDIYPDPPHPEPHMLSERPPIVTIMGHVDHGKTTLLDTLRSASVAKGEVGGITQHIGAFSVPVSDSMETAENKRSITFLDTPGHAAFSAMRARGARITDIIVLVVAADDGVKPQTKEVIDLIKKEANVGVVIALNKVDKFGVNTDAVKKELVAEGLQLETFGGDIPCVEVSGLTGAGLDNLIATISLVAEMLEIRAEREARGHGFVIESRIEKGLGPVATIVVHRGNFSVHDHMICGTTHGRIRQMTDSAGKEVKIAYPGMPVTVSGWKELPNAGDEVLRAGESQIKKAVANRLRRAQLATVAIDADVINEQRSAERKRRIEEANKLDAVPQNATTAIGTEGSELKLLRLVVKCDVSGSEEAVVGALQGIGNHLAQVKVIHSGVGDVLESDIQMAETAGAAIVAFTVNTSRSVAVLAATRGVPIVSSSIIYRLMEDVQARVVALLPPVVSTKVTGEANVLQLFNINVRGRNSKLIAGCRGRNGTLSKAQDIRVLRNRANIFEGPIETLKHHKNDIQEVDREMDFGISLHGFEDFQVGDIIQSIRRIETPGKL